MTSTTVSMERNQYSIGWIAALPHERAAATAILDERHEDPIDFEHSPSDSNVYTLGRVGVHNVVVVSLAAGVLGTISAATTASSMLASFPHIRFGLMVGIGAGLTEPGQGRDIRLGDVVVSQPTGTSGGVVQYDSTKIKAGRSPERIGALRKPPEAMLKALAKLQADHELDDSQVPEILKAMADRHPKLTRSTPGKPSYRYQGFEHDRLFLPTYEHVGGDDCCNCDSAQLIQRDERLTSDPEIHYGVIASGNSLIKDATTRDQLARLTGEDCLCFEMEAAGLMDAFPCLVIRGICDYADSHKHDRWQRYAAATAAAFAKEFLSYIPVNELIQTPRAIEKVGKQLDQIQEQSGRIESSVQITNDFVEKLVLNSQHQKIITWLSAPDPSSDYNRARQNCLQGTGSWFIEGDEFVLWKTQPHSFIWLCGLPGCGKTILSSTIIRELEEDACSSQQLLYFYFDFNDTSKESHDNMIRSLICQLYYWSGITRKKIDMFFATCEHGHRQPTTESLCKIFVESMEQSNEVWLVLDALDECNTRKQASSGGLLPWVTGLLNLQLDNVHLLVTSRPHQDIQKAFKGVIPPDSIIRLQSDIVADDISTYIRARVRGNGGFQRWRQQPKVQAEIEMQLGEKAHGMFRWVACQLDILEDCTDLLMLRDAITSLPETLDETYARILDGIPPYHRRNAIRILQFLVYSERPLRREEAVDAIAVELEANQRFQNKNRMPKPEEITSSCSSLVTTVYVADTGTGQNTIQLQLAHFSVKEYLVSARLKKDFSCLFEERLARSSIAKVCLAYLVHLNLELSVREIREEFPFAQYCARYWMTHVVGGKGDKILQGLLMEFLTQRHSSYANCCKLYNPDTPWDEEPTVDTEPPPTLYYASLVGIYLAVHCLLQNGADVSAQGGRYRNALQAASFNGHREIVELLLAKDADVNARGSPYGTALQAASSEGYREIVQLLLAKAADVNAPGGFYGTALQAASSEGYREVVQLLLAKAADVNAPGGFYGSALQAASSSGHCEIVQLLLAKAADVNARGGRYGTALQAASLSGHCEIVQLLLAKDADVNAPGGAYGTALQAASSNGHREIVQLLLAKDADVNAWGRGHGTALQAASSKGHREIVQLLLAKDADVNVQGGHYRTALQAASSEGHREIVQLLLQAKDTE